MDALTYGRTGVLHLPRPARRSSGLWGLSRRFWAVFVLGSVLIMLDAFETMAALAWTPVPGHPGLVARHASEGNPIWSAAVVASPWLLPVIHLVQIGLFLGLCWFSPAIGWCGTWRAGSPAACSSAWVPLAARRGSASPSGSSSWRWCSRRGSPTSTTPWC